MKFFAIDRRDRDVLLLALIIISVFTICLATKGLLVFRPLSYLISITLFGYVALAWCAFRVLKILLVERPDTPTKNIVYLFTREERLSSYVSVLAMLAALIAFMPTFSAIKSAIPLFNDYSWDGFFIRLDQQIHGNDPWRILQPLIGYPVITTILAGFYHLWLILIYVVSFYFALNKNLELRQRYFIAYLLCWSIVGAGLAIAFASVGPCFVEPIVGYDNFTSQMEYLRDVNKSYPVLVLDVQNVLLARYQSGDTSLGSGITAMPSMHVAQAFLFFLAARHISRVVAWIFGIFFVIILIGSVHLAYHYAVDGYVAIIATALIWKLTGWWVSRVPELQSTAN